MHPDDDNIKDSQSDEPIDNSNFLQEMRDLYETDPEEATARLEDAGYSVADLDLAG